MRGNVRRLFVALLLALCVGVHVLEVSGRWDQTFHDANDEAGVVAVVLCIGVAVSVARTLLKTIRLTRIGSGFVTAPTRVVDLSIIAWVALPTATASPPLALRI